MVLWSVYVYMSACCSLVQYKDTISALRITAYHIVRISVKPQSMHLLLTDRQPLGCEMTKERNSSADDGYRLCLSVPEAAKLLGISRGLAYELVRTRQLPVVRFGRRVLIPRAALEQMLGQTEARSES